jgi:16S rRNA (uracil1498-N3)-methyltransferase
MGETATEIDVLLWVGPEGGWTPEELDHLRELNSSMLSLGQRVLRVETAALIAASHCLLA